MNHSGNHHIDHSTMDHSMHHSTNPHQAHHIDNFTNSHGATDNMTGSIHDLQDHSSMDHSSMDHSSMDHSSMDHSSMDHSSMDHSSMGHSMYFHSSPHSTILFSFWQTNSFITMLVSCLAIIIMAVSYEGLKALREKLLMRNACCGDKMCGQNQVSTVAASSFGGGDNNQSSKDEPLFNKTAPKSPRMGMWNAPHIIQCLMHGLQILLSYFLMLIFMTYNVWPCLAVIVGAMLGYFLFSWKRKKCPGCGPVSEFVISDHCH